MKDWIRMEVHTIRLVYCPKEKRIISALTCEDCKHAEAVTEEFIECSYEPTNP